MAHILVVDDDDLLREVIATALTQTGHNVFQAGDGHQAVELVRANTIDLVLTDILMPGQEGIETIMQLRFSHPTIRIVAMSGGSPHSKFYLDIASRLGARRILAKPFTPADLLHAITTVLAEPPAPPPLASASP